MQIRSIILLLTFLFSIASASQAQHRKAVNAKEVTGTFRDGHNNIQILALGNNRLRVSFFGLYPLGNGDANTGYVAGEARIDADSAVYYQENDESFEPCIIVIHFLKPGLIEVEHRTGAWRCGFGAGVSIEGTYRKVSSKKPKIKADI